jgi:hypothetical protein
MHKTERSDDPRQKIIEIMGDAGGNRFHFLGMPDCLLGGREFNFCLALSGNVSPVQ